MNILIPVSYPHTYQPTKKHATHRIFGPCTITHQSDRTGHCIILIGSQQYEVSRSNLTIDTPDKIPTHQLGFTDRKQREKKEPKAPKPRRKSAMASWLDSLNLA